ncbi:Mediator of RNA polymerase II transcription subunit 27 [Podila minutissima]|uniref:Mediator of RNA polymerase II transcription subunit 27 n=1 Tax=Podila minutissima TaxID=64525 RepID=A0A9P5SBX8_9FUNG|nr:Mediator of RNA polymerase II transcription subunit 27 [Podila minutissima]
MQQDPAEIRAAIEKNKNVLQDIELMINSLHDVRSSIHHVFHILQSRAEPESGASFREHAKFTYTALECLAKLALSSDAVLNETQALELPKLQGPSPVSIEAKQLEARMEDQDNGKSKDIAGSQPKGKTAEQISLEYTDLSIDATLRKFYKSMKSAGRLVRASRVEGQSSLPTAVIKVTISAVMNAYLVLERDDQSRCMSVSRIVVFGAGEETSIWEDSHHLVFKKISQIATGAVDHFVSKDPQSLLGATLEWLAHYTTLFSSPCVKCAKHLCFDSQQFKLLPPTFYTYNTPTVQPYHPQCLS